MSNDLITFFFKCHQHEIVQFYGTLDLLVLKIASAQPVCFIICGKETRLKRNLKGKYELRKIGNRMCAIFIVTEKRTVLLNVGHLYAPCVLIKLVSPEQSDA